MNCLNATYAMTDYHFNIAIEGKELSCYYITTKDNADKAVVQILNSPSKAFGFDMETGKKVRRPKAGLDPFISFISLIQIYDPKYSRIYIFDCKQLGLWKGMMLDLFKQKRFLIHNALFDDKFLYHNVWKETNVDCTMMMYNLVRHAKYGSQEDEEAEIALQNAEDDFFPAEGEGISLDWLTKGERYRASLRAVVAKLLGFEIRKDEQQSDWNNRPLTKDQIMYAGKDAWLAYEIGAILIGEIKELGLAEVYRLNKAAMKPVIAMMLAGMKIDKEAHQKHVDEWVKTETVLEKELLRIFNGVNNINSNVQLSNHLKGRLKPSTVAAWPRSEKTGALKLDAKTLSMYKHSSAIQKLLEYKKTQKMVSTYGQSLIDGISGVTGRLHCSYTLGYTATGRMSSREPNLQNAPRTPEFRKIFIADEGHTFVGADYSQIEIRVAAELSRDPKMLQVYTQGRDIYRATAAAILGRKEESIAKDSKERQIAKSLCLGLIYGLGAKGLVAYAAWNYDVQLTQQQAWEYYNAFFETYSVYKKWQEKQRAFAARTGTISTVTGKVRRLHEKGAYTRSVNHPVQGAAAEVVLGALCRVFRSVNALNQAFPADEQIKMVNCVHDEIILEAPCKHKDAAARALKQDMEQSMLQLFPAATLNKLVEVKFGASWANLK